MAETGNTRTWTAMAHGWKAVERSATYFMFANFLDGALTYVLAMHGGQRGTRFIEGNRVPAYFLNHWGWKGMFGFKLAIVAFVCAVALFVARSQPVKARWMLNLGTAIVSAAVMYSAWLGLR